MIIDEEEMENISVVFEKLTKKVEDQAKEILSLTEQLQLMTGKYNGAKELFKQYQNEKP